MAVKTKIVMMNDLVKNNPQLCLRPIRQFGECYKCADFLDKFKKIVRAYPEITDGNILLELTINELKCNPQIDPSKKERLAELFTLYAERMRVNRQIREKAKELEISKLEGI